jgi:Domain of unknown function (DUF397)
MSGPEAATGREAARSGWRRASICAGGECVEVAAANGRVQIRNSTDPSVAVTVFPADWRVFIEAVKAGEFDDFGLGDV